MDQVNNAATPKYVWQRPDWPRFRWDDARIGPMLAELRHKQGRLLGRMEFAGFKVQEQALLSALTNDVVKSSEIEGEKLDADQVRSSIARRLGIEFAGLRPSDRHVDGIVEMLLDATRDYKEPLTAERIFGWHAALFPTGYSGLRKIQVGQWRNNSTAPMRVVSGRPDKEIIHFEPPPNERVPAEMDAFLSWFEAPTNMDQVMKAAIAHLWAVTVHGLEDGNGRVVRAIADMQLARSENSPRRFYSMSEQIRIERTSYYEILEKTQKGDLDITEWHLWFFGCLGRAIDRANAALDKVKRHGQVWSFVDKLEINERQRKVIAKLLEDFEGPLTTSKYAKITGCSADTAWRDLSDLVEKRVLTRSQERGRSTNYSFVIPAEEAAEV